MKPAIRVALLMLAGCVCAVALVGCNGGGDEDEERPAQAASSPGAFEPVPDRFLVEITPQAETYEIPRDLGTVRNLAHYSELTNAQKRRLADVGFAVVPDDAEQMFFLYEDYADTSDAANFVTVDSLLQAYHVFFDFSLRTVEEQHLIALARQMTEQLAEAAQAQLAEAPEGPLQDAALRTLAYFAVAGRLLEQALGDQVPAEVAELVGREFALIEAHQARVF